jgi:hypothetical protein
VPSVPWADPLTLTVFANALRFDEMIRLSVHSKKCFTAHAYTNNCAKETKRAEPNEKR